MSAYAVTHGDFILDGVTYSRGAVVELSDSEALRLDPAGGCLALVPASPEKKATHEDPPRPPVRHRLR